jgi:hypothetical protein
MTTQPYRSVTKNIFFAVLMLLLSGCSSTPHHSIIGANGWGWNITPETNIRVIQDLQVNDLRVRQVRKNSTSCKSGYTDHLELQGPIGPDSTRILERIFDSLPKCYNEDGVEVVPTVYLASGGGRLADGFAMGNLFRKVGVQAIVPGEATCASSCAVAFLGGKWRSMGPPASLMFHAPYTLSNSSSWVYGATTISIDCSDRGQVADLKNYYFKMLGANDGRFLLDRTLAYCSRSEGWTINRDAARLFGLITE